MDEVHPLVYVPSFGNLGKVQPDYLSLVLGQGLHHFVMDYVIQIGVRLYHVYKGERHITVDAVYGTYDSEVASAGVAQPVVLYKTGPHANIDVRAYLDTFPGLVYPEGLFLLTLVLVTHIVLGIEVKLLLACLRVIALHLLDFPA